MYRGIGVFAKYQSCQQRLTYGLYDKLTTSNKHKSLEERAMEFNGDLMLDGEYDWGELVGREKI